MTNEEFFYKSGVTSKVLKKRGWTVTRIFEAAGVRRKSPDLASRFEERVQHVLRVMFPESKIETQKKFQWLLGELGGFLSFDFYVEDQNLLIEADGKQHISSRGGMFSTEKIQAHDEIKTRFAKERGIRLARVSQTLSESKIRQQVLDSIAVIQPEKNEGNALNNLCGDQCSAHTQASKTLNPEYHIEITQTESHAIYKRAKKSDAMTVLLDFNDVPIIGTHFLYKRHGCVYHSKNGKLAARLFLGLQKGDKRYVKYLNGDRFDLRKSNLSLIHNADLPRTRRLTKRSSTGIIGIHKIKGTVKGTCYYSICAMSHKVKKNKVFAYIKYGGEKAAIAAAKAWLDSIEGSTSTLLERVRKFLK